MNKCLFAALALLAAASTASAQNIVVNEFYRGGNLTTTDEWIEVVLLQDLTAAQLNTYLVGDSTTATAAKFGAFQFNNMGNIASDFPAGTIIVIAGTTGPAADGSYDPANGDWNLTLKTTGANITTVTGGADLGGPDVAWVDTVAAGATIAPNGFCVNYDSTPGVFGAVCQVTIGQPNNNTGAALGGDVVSDAGTTASWTISVAPASTTPGQPNGGANTTSIDALRAMLAGTPVLSLDSPSVIEGNSGDMPLLTFTATLDIPANGDCVFSAETFDAGGPNEATPNVDYVVSSFANLTIPDGMQSVQFSVPVIGDDLIEGDEIVTIDIFGEPDDCDIFSAANFGTIIDDDVPLPQFVIDDVAIAEGTGPGSTTAVFTVTLQNPPPPPPGGEGGTISVDYATMNGSAQAGIDYTATSGTLFFTGTPGETMQIPVPITREDIFEADESFSVMLSFPFGATIADDTGAGTILNDDGFPVPSVQDIAQLEGSGGGTTPFNFTVTLSNPSSTPIAFGYSTIDGTAVAPGDYDGTAGGIVSLSFAPLQTQGTVTINAVADNDPEANELFSLEIYANAPAPAPLLASAIGTLINDDFTLSIDDVTVTEGTGAGTTTASFTVSISDEPPPGLSVTVDYATAAGSAGSPADFAATSGTLSFGNGLPLTQPVNVAINRDNLDELDEQFTVQLSGAVNAAIADGSGTGSITDDDTAVVDIDDLSQAEGNGGGNTAFVFQLSLSNPADRVLNFSAFTSNNSAVAPGDFAALSNQLVSFPAGSQSATVTVQVVADNVPEPDEQFFVQINDFNPPGVEGFLASATGTILNDDTFMLSVADASVTEGTGPGSTTLDFVVTLSSAPLPQTTVTVDYATTAGSALSPEDFAATSGTLTFTPTGPLSQTINVPVVRDDIDENNEGLNLDLSNAVGANIVDGGAAGTIIDDDLAPIPQVADQSLVEGDSGSQTMVFTINLPNPSSFTLNFAVWTVDGTATSPADYSGIPAATPQIISFAPGQTTQTVSITVLGDVLVEGNEAFSLVVDFVGDDDPAGGPLAMASGGITDDDTAVLSIDDVTAAEGNGGGLTPFVFTVSTSKPFAVATAVPIHTFPGTAVEPDDYLGQVGTVTLPAMALSAPLTIQVVADGLFEPTETFTVELGPVPLSTIGDGEGLGTILDDEVAIPVPLLAPGGLLLMLLAMPWLARGRLRRLQAGR